MRSALRDRPNSDVRVLMLIENSTVPQDRRVMNEARSLLASGYRVSVIAPADSDQPLADSIDGIRIWRYRQALSAGGVAGYAREYLLALASVFWLMLRISRDPGFDIIHAGNPPDLFLLVAFPFRLLGKRFIFDQHDLAPELYSVLYGRSSGLVVRLLHWSEAASYRLSNAVIVCNESYRRIACLRGKVPVDRVFVVRNGPHANWPKQSLPDASLKRGRRYMVLYMGAMGHQDGVDVLIDIVSNLVAELGFQDATFALVGDGAAVPKLRQQAKALGIEEYVDFVGWTADPDVLSTYLATADACVSPEPPSALNDHSTFIKVMEYVAAGQPIVAFDLPETRTTARDAALYARPGDTREFARLLHSVLCDPTLASRVRAAAARRGPLVRWERQVPSLLDAYDCALGRAFCSASGSRRVLDSDPAVTDGPLDHAIDFWKPRIDSRQAEALHRYTTPDDERAVGVNAWRPREQPAHYRIREGATEFSLFAAVQPLAEVPPTAEVVAEILDLAGRHHSYVLWFADERAAVVPFDPKAATEAFWREEYIPESERTLLPRPVLRLYYALRCFTTNRVRIQLRKMLSNGSHPPRAFLRWPSDASLDSLQRLLLRLLIMSTGRPQLQFAWFWPDGHPWVAVLTHDVETSAGLPRVPEIMELERAHGLRSSFNFVPDGYTTPVDVRRHLEENDFEVGVHGYRHDGLMFSSPRTFRKRAVEVNSIARDWSAQGFRSPATYRDWRWVGLLDFKYDSSVADTAPFEPQPGGCASRYPYFIDSLIELPMTLPQDHTLFGVLEQDCAEQWFSGIDSISAAHAMACCLTHPDPTVGYIGLAENEAHYRRLLEVISNSDAWKALPREVADWWRRRAFAPLDGSADAEGALLGLARLSDSGHLEIIPPRKMRT